MVFFSATLSTIIKPGWQRKKTGDNDDNDDKGKVHEKKSKKNLTSVSFMYVCVAENAELLVFFTFFLHLL